MEAFQMGVPVLLRQQFILAYERAGEGADGDPVRFITQLFTTDGDLICQWDPCSAAGTYVTAEFHRMLMRREPEGRR